jgi:hypothetical protein
MGWRRAVFAEVGWIGWEWWIGRGWCMAVERVRAVGPQGVKVRRWVVGRR